MNAFQDEVAEMLKIATGLDEISLSVPPNPQMGDYAFACFQLAKEQGKNPVEAAKELAESLPKSPLIQKVVPMGPYLNVFLDKPAIAEKILVEILEKRENFGRRESNGETVVLDFSSPNIAKPFGIHHLRTTVIGNALTKMYGAMGYETVAVNHLGDWGTQYAKLMVAYRLWGDQAELNKNPIKHLLALYVRVNKEVEQNEQLKEEISQWFQRLEDGDDTALELWEQFRSLSLREFNKIYDILQVKFDTFHGEAFYNNMLKQTVDRVKEAGIAVESEGALVVDLSDLKVPPLMLLKSNGTSTYHTRDLAAAFFRIKEYKPAKILYVVGCEQKLHFKQLFTVLNMMGESLGMFEHVDFGRMQFEDGQMSTRKGQVLFLEDVLDKAMQLAHDIIEKKNPELRNKDQVAKWVGVGALMWWDLMNDRVKDVTFSWDRALDFEGETGPYVQYTHARICSILRKSEIGPSPKVQFASYNQAEEHALIMHLTKFESSIADAIRVNKPHLLSRYLLVLAQLFNEFYHKCPVISDMEHIQKARILLVQCVAQTLRNGLSLLGLHAPEEM